MTDRERKRKVEKSWIEAKLTCAFEFSVKKLRHGFDAEAERGVTAGQVAVGGQRWAGTGVAT